MDTILHYIGYYGITQQRLFSRCALYLFVILYIVPYNRYNGNSLDYGHKIWMQSTSLGKPDGWYDRKIPCPGQKIILPENEVVYFPNSLTIGPEIRLPHNGMIILPSSGKYEVK